MILSQRYLADRIIQEGGYVPQLHFTRAVEEYGEITPDIYSQYLQLYIPEEEVNGEMRLVVHSKTYRAKQDPMGLTILRGMQLS